MEAINYTVVRQTLAQKMDQVCDDHTPIIVTRQNNRSVVMLSLEDYQALEETAYLLRSPRNAKRLMESILELESGRGTERGLME
ncbi:MAG: type II toxin-antitoxin system prevent-host-death family antitoxin [Anaerolineae bacterium]|nr:type II toxin-antitoxin system prevent-host-death family antitoxin [Anaerolineae bacterium]